MESIVLNTSNSFERNIKKIATLEDFEKMYGNDLNGIVNNEPPKNSYHTIDYHQMNKFPYYLIGKIVSKYKTSSNPPSKNYINGVGILIGPKIVLTVAHNLCHIDKGKMMYTNKVFFYPASNGDFVPFSRIKSKNYYIPGEYIKARLSNSKDKQLAYDWGIVFLNSDVGNSIIDLFDIENKEKDDNIKVIGNFYNFFIKNKNIDLSAKNTIALVGYTEYRNNYKNTSVYKFLNSFIKDDCNNTTINNTTTNTSNICDEINFTNISSQMISFDTNQGKLTSEIINEGKEFFRNSLKSNRKSSNESDHTSNNTTESIFYTSPIYNKENGIDFIILNSKNENKEFDNGDVDKVIMSESVGEISKNEVNQNNIAYKISTYKGQSGSPVFLLIKNQQGTDEYVFIGIHSRRGPSRGELLYEQCLFVTRSREGSVQIEQRDTDTTQERLSLISFISNSSVTRLNGICDYNLALGVYGERKKEIIEVINSKILCGNSIISKEEDLKSVSSKNYETATSFVNVKLIHENEVKFNGLFKFDIQIKILFDFAAKILMIPAEYILLSMNTDDILNYNYDREKMLIDIIDEDDENDNKDKISFELMINMKKYGEYLANKIVNDLITEKGVVEAEVKQSRKKYIKDLFGRIFKEIEALTEYPVTYGKLFKKIRKKILLRLEL